jgi:hypothetical protein
MFPEQGEQLIILNVLWIEKQCADLKAVLFSFISPQIQELIENSISMLNFR